MYGATSCVPISRANCGLRAACRCGSRGRSP